jgi:hypothetical protein
MLYDSRGETKQGILWTYLHWGLPGITSSIVTALENARDRWTDDSYGQRIFVHSMFEAGELSATHPTGGGLHFNFIGDNEHRLWVADFVKQEMTLYPRYRGNLDTPDPIVVMSFEQFINRYGPKDA